RFVQRFDFLREVLPGLPDAALWRDHLRGLPQIVRRVHDVVVTAPGPAAERVVAGPRDGREGGEDAVAEHHSALYDAGEVRDRFPVVLEALLELRVAQPIEEQDVGALGFSGLFI